MAEPKPKRPTADVLLDNAPWKPAHWEIADATALKQVYAGTASPEMQKRAMAYILDSLCGIQDWPFRPGGEDGARDTMIALGRQYVGHGILKLVKIDLSKVRRN